MPAPRALYTAENCLDPAYQLNWSVSVFWKSAAPSPDTWLTDLQTVAEDDGTRILEQRLMNDVTSQFLVSTKPEISPPQIVRCLKGRLQYLVRQHCPKAFCRNYALTSVGSAKADAVEEYVRSQFDHHRLTDVRLRTRMDQLRFENPDADLIRPRSSGHAQFVYNLHLILVHEGRLAEVDTPTLRKTREMICGASRKKQHLLSVASMLPDHVHLALGCNLTESPREVALSYLNNLAYAQGQKPVYRSGYFVGTFGPYDLGAVRQAFR